MAITDEEYVKDKEQVNEINSLLQLESLEDYDLNEYYEYDESLSVEKNLMRKFALKKRGRDLRDERDFDSAIAHQLILLENSYFSNDYYPYRHLVIKYELTKQKEKMTETIRKFFRSGIYAHQRQIDWFYYKLHFLEEDGFISKLEIDELLEYYESHGALAKSREHDPVYIADRLYQRKNGTVMLDTQWAYERQERKYAMKEKGGFLERNKMYDEAIDFYSDVLEANANGSSEAYRRLALIYEKLGMFEEEFEIIKLFYKKKYRQVGKYTKEEFELRIRNLNDSCGTDFTSDDFITSTPEFDSTTITNFKSSDELLLRYAELYEKGLLTREEFEKKKKELLFFEY